MAKKVSRIETVVGEQVYTVWIDMLQELVPWGRTHRLSTVVAGMLRYASALAVKSNNAPVEGSVEWKLSVAEETVDPQKVEGLILELIEQLFKDAEVQFERHSARGDRYSIAESAIIEYLHWDDMPWE